MSCSLFTALLQCTFLTTVNQKYPHTCCACHTTTSCCWTFKTRFALNAALKVRTVCITSQCTRLRKGPTVCAGIASWAVIAFRCSTKRVLSCYCTWNFTFLRCAAEKPWPTSNADGSIVARDFSSVAAYWQLVA